MEGTRWGKALGEFEDWIQQDCNARATVFCIGPGGEKFVRYAAVMDKEYHAEGRSRLEAVMGAKCLKAIACSGDQAIRLAAAARFQELVKIQTDLLKESLLKVGNKVRASVSG